MQVEALLEAGGEENRIFIDEMSGLMAAKGRTPMAKLTTVPAMAIDRRGGESTASGALSAGNPHRPDHHGPPDQPALHMDGVDPSSSHGRLQLALFASLAQYERELFTERVHSGVMAAQAREVKFGLQAPKQETIETKLRAVRQLLADGFPAAEAAEAVGWARPTMYRYLKRR